LDTRNNWSLSRAPGLIAAVRRVLASLPLLAVVALAVLVPAGLSLAR
jgi:hypothetical protein